MTFFHTLPGMYVTQSVLHSLLALVLVEFSFFVWGIRDHLSMFRYRLLTLTLPVFMFPAYQLVSPERSDWYFRTTSALFDSQRWLELKAFGIFPAALLFLLFLAFISAVFILQEILPNLRIRNTRLPQGTEVCPSKELEALIGEICQQLNIPVPSIVVIDETHPILFTQGYNAHTIVISSHVVELLDYDQMKGALTHEAVHMLRGSSMKTQIIYFLRMLLFFNPVSLIEFRRIVHDDEFLCDAVTVQLTRNPAALAAALTAFYFHADNVDGRLAQVREQIETHSHNLLLEQRIQNLKDGKYDEAGRFHWTPFMLTASSILFIGYLVV